MPTMPKADRPNMLIDRFPAALGEQAKAIYARRAISIGDWMNRPDAPTMGDYARHLCREFGITSPDVDLVNRIIRLAAKDY